MARFSTFILAEQTRAERPEELGDGVRASRTLDTLNFVLAGAREGFGPFIAVYLQARGFDQAMIGVVMSLAGVGGLAATTPIGVWVDHSHHKRRLLMLAVLIIAIGALVIVATKSIVLVGVAQTLIGVGDTALAPLIAAMSLGIVGHGAFAHRMSRNEAFNNGGNAARSALAAALGYYLGLEYVAVTIVLSSIASAIVVKQLDPNAIDYDVARGGECDDQPMWKALLGMPGLLLLAVAVFVYQASSSSMLPFLAEARTAAGDDPSLTTGAMCVVARLMMVPAALLAPRLAAWRGYSGVMTLVLALVVVRACLAYYTSTWALVITVEILEGLTVGMASVAIPALNAEVMAGTGRANAALGLLLTAFGAGATVSPLIGGFVSDHYGFAGCFVAFAIVAMSGLILWVGARPLMRERSRLEPVVEVEPEPRSEKDPPEKAPVGAN